MFGFFATGWEFFKHWTAEISAAHVIYNDAEHLSAISGARTAGDTDESLGESPRSIMAIHTDRRGDGS